MRCRACNAELVEGVRFCGSCGSATRQHARAVHSAAAAAHRAALGAAAALGCVVAGTLLGFVVAARLTPDDVEGVTWGTVIGGGIVLLLAGLAGAAMLGKPGIPASLARVGNPLWILAAVPAAVATFAIAQVWIRVMLPFFESGGSGVGAEEQTAALAFAVLVLAPVLEEWLCRGVAWEASLRLGGATAALWTSALVFAFLHGLNGGYLLELPHRLGGGLVLGWLRLRSGSLLPGIGAHFLHNLTAWLAELD